MILAIVVFLLPVLDEHAVDRPATPATDCAAVAALHRID
jgi:hypothetical protein